MADRSAVHYCLNIITDVRNTLTQARRAFMAQDTVIVNKNELLAKLDDLYEKLPDTLQTAKVYVEEHARIMQQAEQDCNTKRITAERTASKTVADAEQQAKDLLAHAQQQADQLIADANTAAQAVTQRANEDATALMEGARQEAQRVVSEAALKAEQMVEADSVLRRARATAEEVTADTHREMAKLRESTFDYLDRVMEHVDRSLSDTLAELRLERTQLNHHR